MKINKLMLAVLAGAMFASCSESNGDEPTTPSDAVGSEGYIGISISMPSSGMSRGQNDQFNDGLESEYKVEDACLIFFTGKESEAKFYKAYQIDRGEWNGVHNNQITQNQVVTFPVDFAQEAEGNLWALAVINPGSVLTVNRGNTLTVDGNAFTGTIKDFLALTTTQNLSQTGKFFMTNSPYSSAPGTTKDVSQKPQNVRCRVLSPVNKDRIFATAEAAKDMPAAALFVERAVAKVEVNATGLKIGDNAINFPAEDYRIADSDWGLDNTEPSTFIVRNLTANYDGTNVPEWVYYDTNTTQTSLTHHYRFLGNTGFGHTFWPNTPDPDEHYRTYFGVDPNGNGIEEGTNLKPIAANGFTNTGSDNPLYCYENTFDVAHMDYRNTTRAIIKVTFNNNDDRGNLYTVGEDKTNVYYFEDAASYLTFAVLNDVDVVAAWNEYFDDNTYEPTTVGMDYNRSTRVAENEWMTVRMNANETTGRLEVTSVVLKDGQGNAVPYAKSAETAARVNSNVVVKYYKDGVAYYAVRIRHFGNDLAPWTTASTTTNTTTESYGRTEGAIGPQDIQNYLGRYGVLRNNWYVLNLGTINKMGEPIVGDLPLDGTPDDRVVKEESISCRINILSWAKREQSDNL